MAFTRPFVKPQYYFDKLRVKSALQQSYPIYTPPNLKSERDLSRNKAIENFEYFMENRILRVRYFENCVNKNFTIAFDGGANELSSYSRWFFKYAAYLVPTVERMEHLYEASFTSYAPSWSNEFVGMNVIFDAGTWLGNYFCKIIPNLYWKFNEGHKFEKISKKYPDFRKPILDGTTNGTTFSPIFECHKLSQYQCYRKYMFQNNDISTHDEKIFYSLLDQYRKY